MFHRKKLILVLEVTTICLTVVACNFTTPTQSQPQAPGFPTEDPHLDVERVSLEDAKAAFDSGSAVFVDVRENGYAQGHIPGALSIPGTELPARLDELDPDQWIITYCT